MNCNEIAGQIDMVPLHPHILHVTNENYADFVIFTCKCRSA